MPGLDLQPINDWLNYFIKFHRFPSIAIGIVDLKNQQTFSYGIYDKEKNVIGNNTYCIASLSKILTSIEILKLVDKEIISLEDTIKKYIENFSDETITIKDILSHTAGLPRDGDFNFWLSTEFPNTNQLNDYIKNIKINNKGSYKYSNLGYAIIGLLLEKQGIILKQSSTENIIGYGKKIFNEEKKYQFIDHKAFTSSFGMYMNIEELTELAQKILKKDKAILSKRAWDLMFEVHHERSNDLDDICLPWEKWKSENVYELSGYGFGFTSSILIDFDSNLGFTVLTNTNDEDYAAYFTRTIRRYIKYFLDNNIKIDNESNLNGTYRCKDYDVMVFDCREILYVFKPQDTTPFHPDNVETYRKLDENKYLIEKQDDPYINEFLNFEFEDNNIVGFRQGGWGYKKLSSYIPIDT